MTGWSLMPKSPIEETLDHWLETAKYFEQYMIDESTFLNAQTEALTIASSLTNITLSNHKGCGKQ